MKKENKDDLVFAILSFLVSFFFYLKTLMPGVGGWGDSARFSFFGKTLGISYPTGYPLYIILDNLFSRLPVGTLSFRTNMMSAFFASLTAAVLYLTIRKLNGNKLLSFVSVLIFAFSGMFWSQSIIAEVYTLNAFFISIMILLLISWSETRDIRLLYLSLFIYGLSFGNHLTMILLFPSIIYLILVTDRRVFSNMKIPAFCIFLILLGAVQYLYLFIRSSVEGGYMEMRINTLKDFIWSLSGGHFRAEMFSGGPGKLFLQRLPVYISELTSQFSFGGIFAGIAGICVLFRDRIKYALFFLISFACYLFFSLTYGIQDIAVYFIPSYLIFAVFIGKGLEYLTKPYEKTVTGAAIVLCVTLCYANYAPVDKSRMHYVDRFADTVLENMEGNSLLISTDFNSTQYYLYKILGEGKRKNDNISVVWSWSEPALLIPYLKQKRMPGPEDIRSGKIGGYPSIPPFSELYGTNIYFQGESKKIMDKAGIRSSRVLVLLCQGQKLELYKITQKGAGKEKFIDLNAGRGLSVLRRINFVPRDMDYLISGWSRSETDEENTTFCWSVEKESSVKVRLKSAGDYRVSMRIRPMSYEDSPQQTMEIFVNGKYFTKLDLKDGWEKYVLSVPASFWQDGENAIGFRYGWLASPEEVSQSPDPRYLAVAFDYVAVKQK